MPSCALGCAWALVAVAVSRQRLRRDGLQARAPGSRWLPGNGGAGVLAVLERLEPTCLERSLVLQRWFTDHGHDLDLVIGVRRAAAGVQAHAWLEGTQPSLQGEDVTYDDLVRLPPQR